MRPFKWTKAHAAFVPEIDAEHRNLYRMADDLRQSVDAGVEQPVIVQQLRGLIAAAEDHLTYEERLMRSTHYDAFDWHKHQHDTFRKRAGEFVHRIENGDLAAASLLLTFVAGWLNDHTALADRMLGAYLRNHDRLAS